MYETVLKVCSLLDVACPLYVVIQSLYHAILVCMDFNVFVSMAHFDHGPICQSHLYDRQGHHVVAYHPSPTTPSCIFSAHQ